MRETWRPVDPGFPVSEAIADFELVMHPTDTVFEPRTELDPEALVNPEELEDQLARLDYIAAGVGREYPLLGHRDQLHIRNMAFYLTGARRAAIKYLGPDPDDQLKRNYERAAELAVMRSHQEDLSAKGLAAQWQHDCLHKAAWLFDDQLKAKSDESEEPAAETEAETETETETTPHYTLEELIGIETIKKMLDDVAYAAKHSRSREVQALKADLLTRGLTKAVIRGDYETLMKFSGVALTHYERKARYFYLATVKLTDSRYGGHERRSRAVREEVFLYNLARRGLRRS